ncbi:MAG: TonB-dependent receptor [Acidobacteriota bacterium]|nr:TonB-dependent receptor [Acidobacteriota bacterium]
MGNPTRIALSAVLVIASVCLAPAQTFNAQVTGEVTDASGAVVPGVRLTMTNLATHTVSTATSNAQGIYRFPDLNPAQYKLSCANPGFKTFEQGPITLQVNQTLEVNVQLVPGDAKEQVTVSAAPPPLETESSTLGQVVTTRSIESLPLNIRDAYALIALTPGVILGSNFGNGGGQDVGRNFFKSDFYVGGGRSGSQEILLDGAPDTTPDVNRGVINPPVDSVQEFKVQANSFDAQFGRTSGGILNMITKSGGGTWHGVGYDFERHSVLDANNFFNNRSGIDRQSFQRHQFGGNAGGPVWKGKWFVFGDYEGLRQAYPSSTISTVPTAQQISGDFSNTFASNGQLIRVYDPTTLVNLPDGTRQRSPFAGNVIPSNRLNPVSAAALSYYPKPNLPGNPVTGTNNYIFASKSITNGDKWDIRNDLNFNANNRMFMRVSRQEDARLVPGNMPLPVGGGRQTNDHYTQAMADVTHIISTDTVADLSFSFTRALAYQFGRSSGFDLTSLKLPASYISQVTPMFPVFSPSDAVATSAGSDSFVQFQPRNVWAVLGNVFHQAGRHALKAGADVRLLHFNEGQNPNASGTFGFSRLFTQGPNPTQASTTGGYGVASMLLGDASSGSVVVINPISTQSTYYGVYFQDDWRVTSKLTLNLGVRWDVGIGDREKYNRLAYFDPYATPGFAAAAGLPNLRGALSWIGGANQPNQQATDFRNFQPRAGFAYSLNDKTVIRGGYGIFFLPRNVQGNGDGAVEAVRTTAMVATLDSLNPANTISNPFPNGLLPALNDRDPLANVGAGVAAPVYAFRNGYSQTWSAGVQRQLPWGLVADVHYWGSKGTRLQTTWNINQLPDVYLSLGTRLNDLVPNPFYGLGLGGVLTGATISRQQSLLPFPQYTGVSQVFAPVASSTYHAATIQIEKRLSSTFTLLAAYTRSKSIDDVRTPLDLYNRSLEKGLSAFDTPNQVRVSGVYNLPFGRDREFGKHLNPVLNAILGDWDLNGILSIQSGQPIGVSRPSVNNGSSAHLDNPTIARWFNTSVFSVAPAYTFGTDGPVLPDVRNDGQRNLDAVLAKNFVFAVADRTVRLQFRSEFYNVANRVQFGSPNGSVSSASFGIVSSQANNPRDIQFGLKVSF